VTDTYSPQSAGRPVVPRQQAGPRTGPRPRTIIVPPQDPGWMTGLRATAYVLTSLASLLFIALVIYGAVQLNRLGNALEEFGSTVPFSSVAPLDPTAPPVP
jgi:hypothetical protein